MHANIASLQSACYLQALARVQRTYFFQSELTTGDRASRGLGIFRRSQYSAPLAPIRKSCIEYMPYCINYSGQTVEAIIGAPPADLMNVSTALHEDKQSPPQPELELSCKTNRYSRPTAFALIPDLRIEHNIHEHSNSFSSTSSTSSDYIPISKRVNGGRYGSNHLLSEKHTSSGALFIIQSFRDIIGVSS